MLKKSVSGVLSRPSPCNVPQGYASVAELPAALLSGLFEQPARVFIYCATREGHQNLSISRKLFNAC